LLPLFKSRSEASTSLRGVLSPFSFDITLQDVPNRAVHRWRSGPVQRAFLDRFQSAADMQPPFYCDYGSNIVLGERVFFNFNCVVLDVCLVKVGDFTLFGPAVQIYTAMHPMNAELRRKQEFGKPIEIGSDVWVGGGAIICPGVKIGSKSVIGAGSVVTKDIPDGVVAAGSPCRVIREITE